MIAVVNVDHANALSTETRSRYSVEDPSPIVPLPADAMTGTAPDGSRVTLVDASEERCILTALGG